MAGQVVQVKRKQKLGPLERIYLPMILRALWVTGRRFFVNLRGFATGKNRRDFVVQYPEERVQHPAAFRGMPVLVAHEDGAPRCVACGLCEYACPSRCIHIVPGELPDREVERYPERFDIDMSRCMFCGLCEEACPEEAIVMSPVVEIATFDRASLLWDKERLLVPAKLVQPRIDFLRSEYERNEEPGGDEHGTAERQESGE
jgi:NADH-quinone oxidoreductase subunit I